MTNPKINIAREIVSRSLMAKLSGTRAKSAPNEISAIWLKIAFIRMGYCAWNRVGSGYAALAGGSASTE